MTTDNNGTHSEAFPVRPLQIGPDVDVIEDSANGTWTIYADMPGAAADSVDVRVDNGTMTIRASGTVDSNDGTSSWAAESPPCTYRRDVALSKDVDVDSIRATFELGVLTIELKKIAAAQPRRIAVRSAATHEH